jgi:hypothetical protein
MRRVIVSVILGLLGMQGCAGDTPPATDAAVVDTSDVPPDLPMPACARAIFDPTADRFDQWPDTRLMVPDTTSATGVRLRVDRTRFGGSIRGAAGFSSIITDLDGLDGFGVNAQGFVRFEGPLVPARFSSAERTTSAEGAVGFVVLSPGAPRFVGALSSTTDDDSTLLLAPLRPLPQASRVVMYVTRRLVSATAANCIEASPALRRLLAEPSDDVREAVEALTRLGAIAGPDDLMALSVFTTQTTTSESQAVAADIGTRAFTVASRRPCVNDPMGRYRSCEFDFAAGNYLDASRHLPSPPSSPHATYTLKATVWLPMERTSGALRTIVYGHGLGGDRSQGARLAEFAAPRGIATVAIDAVMHGEHPLNPMPGSQTLITVLNFFTLDPGATRAFDARALRDHFRQSSYDKLQLVRLLQRGVDVDGDGSTDLDPARLAYLGVSLGGIMGPEPLSLTDAFGAAVLVVPGGRVSGIISDSAMFSTLITLLRPPGTTRGDVIRVFPLLQTVLDRGDAASFGPHVFTERLTPGGSRSVPSALLGVVLDDDTVPNVCNDTLARAMDAPIAPQLLRAVPGLPVLPRMPFSGNAANGRATRAVLQFDVVGGRGGASERATHSNVGASDVGAHAWLHFLTTHWDRGLAEVADPYVALGRAHAERMP